MQEDQASGPSGGRAPKWQPLSPLERRVLGVLIEKAKTTPDAYPMTLNGLRTGCNQKNNRDPVMEVDADQVEAALEKLREKGAVAEIQDAGRVAKYRHFGYDWLGVAKEELAVMAELLLRGAQTEGELRGRAARMDPIPDVAALRPLVDSLKAKGLVVSLSSAGRGQVLTHALYPPNELNQLRAQFGQRAPATAATAAQHAIEAVESTGGLANAPASHGHPAPHAGGGNAAELHTLRAELATLKQSLQTAQNELKLLAGLSAEVAELRRQVESLESWKEAVGG